MERAPEWGAAAIRPAGRLVTERSVRPEQYGSFLTEIFDEWVKRDVGQIFVQSFDAALGKLDRASQRLHFFSDLRQCTGDRTQWRSLRL